MKQQGVYKARGTSVLKGLNLSLTKQGKYMFVGHHYFSLCFDCDKYSRSELTRCHNCKAPAHGEGTSVYFGTSKDLDVISGWAEKMHQLNEEHDQKYYFQPKSKSHPFMFILIYLILPLIFVCLIHVCIELSNR